MLIVCFIRFKGRLQFDGCVAVQVGAIVLTAARRNWFGAARFQHRLAQLGQRRMVGRRSGGHATPPGRRLPHQHDQLHFGVELGIGYWPGRRLQWTRYSFFKTFHPRKPRWRIFERHFQWWYLRAPYFRKPWFLILTQIRIFQKA